MNTILHPVPLILPAILVALILLGVREYLQICEKNRELRERLKLAESNVHFGHTVAWELTARKDALEREVADLRKANGAYQPPPGNGAAQQKESSNEN